MPIQFRSEPEAKHKKPEHHNDEDQEKAFSMMCSYLQVNDEDQLTISDLWGKMKEFLTSKYSLPHGTKYLKRKLQERYGNSIYIEEGEGLHDIVTMREKHHQYLGHTSNTETTRVMKNHKRRQSLRLQLGSSKVTLRPMLNTLFVGKDT